MDQEDPDSSHSQYHVHWWHMELGHQQHGIDFTLLEYICVNTKMFNGYDGSTFCRFSAQSINGAITGHVDELPEGYGSHISIRYTLGVIMLEFH